MLAVMAPDLGVLPLFVMADSVLIAFVSLEQHAGCTGCERSQLLSTHPVLTYASAAINTFWHAL